MPHHPPSQLGPQTQQCSLQETLRILGALLDESHTEIARLTVSPQLIELQASQELQQRRLAPRAQQQETVARRARRGPVETADRTATTRYESLLRVVGAALEDDAPQSYEIVVTPTVIVVTSSGAGACHFFTTDQLVARPQAAPQARQLREPLGARTIAV